MSLFKCNHMWVVEKRSNALQLDEMGYPLRLCICKCITCGESEQQWLDTSKMALDELETGESFLLDWK